MDGHGDGDGAGARTGMEVNEGAQDGNGDGAGTGTGRERGWGRGWGPVVEHRMGTGMGTGTGTEARTVAGMGTGTAITGTRIGLRRAEGRRKSARNRKIAVHAVRETEETWLESESNVEDRIAIAIRSLKDRCVTIVSSTQVLV